MIYAILLLIGGSLVCLNDWRRGIYVVILAGFLQDPIRKLTPGEPVMLSLIAPALFGVCFISALLAEEELNFEDLNRFNPVLYLPSALFVGWVSISTVITLTTTHSLVLAGIGAMAYMAPIPGLMLGYRFARKPDDLLNLLAFYIVVAAVFSSSIFLEMSGVDSPLLKSVGEGFVFYPESGGITVLHSGLFRSPEVAGWHCASAICFLVVIGLSRRPGMFFVLFALVAAAIILPALILTGRRKFLVEIATYLTMLGAMLTYFQTSMKRLSIVFVVASILGAVFFFYITSSERPGEWAVFLKRSSTAQGDSNDRFMHMTVDMFQYVIAQNGFFGSGAGTGSQGAQHFGGGSVLVGAAAEGGLGKVLAELGVPGILFLVWTFSALAAYIWAISNRVRTDENAAPLCYTLVAFLCANAVVFTTAHQIFGDVFILTILGLVLGVLLRCPYFVEAESSAPEEEFVAPVRKRIGRRFADRTL